MEERGRGRAPLWAPFVAALPVTGGSLSVIGGDGLTSTVSTSDELAAQIDAIRVEIGEGPHWQAFLTGEPVLVPDLRLGPTRDAWPLFANAVLATEARGVFSFPLVLGVVVVGVADLYSDTAGADWSDAMRDDGVAIAARSCGPALRLAARSAASEHATATAVELRREVHQATGMLVVQLDISAGAALSRLEAHAFANGRPVLDVARDVVARRLEFRAAPL